MWLNCLLSPHRKQTTKITKHIQYSASGNLTSSVLLKILAANVGRGNLTVETPGMVPPSERESGRGIASLGSDANEPRSLRQLF